MTTQEQTDMVAEMFPVPEGAKRLGWFVGEWALAGTLTMEGNALPVSGGWSMTPAAAGWGVRSVLRGQIEGLGTMEEDDLLGFDQETELIHLYSLTNTGNVHDHHGQWRPDGGFDLVCEAAQQGKPYREEIEVRVTDERRFTVHATERIGGELASVMDVTLTRK